MNINIKEKKYKSEGWVNFPRYITSLFREGIINLAERNLYVWARLNANPYGIYSTSIEQLAFDVFNGKKTGNYINKLLISLKKKGLIWYKRRQGFKGTFEIHFDDFLTPKGLRSLDSCFKDEIVSSGEVLESSQNKDSVQSEVEREIQKIKEKYSFLKSKFSVPSENNGFRSYHKDNDNENKK